MALLDALPAAADAVKQPKGPGETGSNTTKSQQISVLGTRSISEGSFVPGDWASWLGLAAPGMSGSSAELLLDDIMDLQEDLPLKIQELGPRCVLLTITHDASPGRMNFLPCIGRHRSVLDNRIGLHSTR